MRVVTGIGRSGIFVPELMDGTTWRAWFKIGVQTFYLAPLDGTKKSAKWQREMLDKAFETLLLGAKFNCSPEYFEEE